MKKFATLAATAAFATLLFQNTASAANVQVKPGDTLWGLSRTYSTSVNEIKSENNLKSNLIKVGQNLYIPDGNEKLTVSKESNTTTYKVVKGDSLSVIAKRYKTTVLELKRINNLKSDLIRIGQVLKVKGGATKPIQNSQVTTTQKQETIDKTKLVNDAKSLMGTPYKWAGTTPNGFDCSGFMYYVINKQEKVSRMSTAGYYGMMKKVSSPVVGDFVFFTTYKAGPSHMGIYLGNGQFIHAGSDGVTISNMNSSYWKPKYLGAKSL